MSSSNLFVLIFCAYLSAGSTSALLNSKLPKLDERIVNGVRATKDQFPHQVSIIFRKKYLMLRNIHWHCSGSIISTTWILTSAHCIIGYAFQQKIFKNNFVLLGQKIILCMWEPRNA